MGLNEKHFYQIEIKEGDLWLLLSSDDAGFAAQQMRRWAPLFLDEMPHSFQLAYPEPSQPPVNPVSLNPPSEKPPSNGSTEQVLVEQIKQLQQQIQMLSQQVVDNSLPETPVFEEPQSASAVPPPIEAKVLEPPSVVEALSPPLPPAALQNEGDDLSTSVASETRKSDDLDSFVMPAHAEIQPNFDFSSPAHPIEPGEVTSFEQPVNNLSETVMMPPAVESFNDVLAVAEESALSPVTQSVLIESEPIPPVASQPPVADSSPIGADEDNFDLLMDSLSLDLEMPEEEPQATAPIPTMDSPAEQPAPDVIASEAPPDPEPLLKMEEPAPAVEEIGPQELVVQDAVEISQLKSESPAPLETPPSEAPPPEQEEDDLLRELEDALNTDIVSASDPAAHYEAPKVDYDFGIPAVETPDDPRVHALSLETLQQEMATVQTFESPFPGLDDAQPSAGGATPQYQPAQAKPWSAESGSVSSKHLQAETFSELCDFASNATSSSDFLILACYFLSVIKQTSKYTLKELNAQLVRSGLTPVNHGTLESLISNGTLQLVPDVTGDAHAAEYTLTDPGMTYATNLLSPSE